MRVFIVTHSMEYRTMFLQERGNIHDFRFRLPATTVAAWPLFLVPGPCAPRVCAASSPLHEKAIPNVCPTRAICASRRSTHAVFRDGTSAPALCLRGN